jgi:hypothetical protein
MPDENIGATTPTEPTAPAAPATPTPAAPVAPVSDIDAIVNERVNAKLANHKRTLQTQLRDAQQKAAAYDQLQGQVGELLESGLIDGVEDLGEFRQAAAETLDKYKSETERLADEGKRSEKLLAETAKRAEEVTTRYDQAMIRQDVINEAVDKVVSPGALKLVQQHLAAYAQNTDKGVVFNYPVANEEGADEVKPLTAKQAVEAMEANVSDFGTLFKSTVSGGAGDEVVNGVTRTPTGNIDFSNMSMDKYIELQSKNPGALAQTLANTRL